MKIRLYVYTISVLGLLLLNSCGPLTIDISYPDIEASLAPGTEVVFLQSIVDNRKFQDHNRPVNVPSWAGTLKKENERSRIIGRSSHNNVYLAEKRTIDNVIGVIIKNSLFKEGYSVLYKEKGIPGAIEIDVFINNFWVYRASKNLIQAEMDLLFTINAQGTAYTRTVTVTGTNTTEHVENIENWELAVNAMLDEFTNIIRNQFSNMRSSHPPEPVDEDQEDLLTL